MRMRWRTLFIQLSALVVTEIAFNCAGLNDLANYGEFMLDRKHEWIETIAIL